MFKVLELFSGNADITKAFNQDTNTNAYSVDYNPSYNPTYCTNVYTLNDNFLKKFDFIWLSPDCTTYSLASHGLHRIKGGVPVSDYAKQCDENNTALIKRLIANGVPFIIENPRCHFRNMEFVKDLHRITIYFSTYGECYEKPTDLFTNCEDLLKYFDTRHVKGTKHLDYVKQYNNFLGRCKMPKRLIEDIVKSGLSLRKE